VTWTELAPQVSMRLGELPIGDVVLFTVGGRSPALVDTGVARHAAELLLPSLAGREVSLILTTHGHVDHCGGHAAVVAETGAPVALHRGDAAAADADAATFAASELEFAGPLERAGLDDLAAARAKAVEASWSGRFAVGRWLEDGDELAVDGVPVDVVHVPGHTPGSLLFHLPEQRLALAGDAVQAWGVAASRWPVVQQPHAYLATLDRIAELPRGRLVLSHRFLGAEGRFPNVVEPTDVPRLLEESRRFVEVALAAASEVAEAPDALARLVRAVDATLGWKSELDAFTVTTASACLRAAGVVLDNRDRLRA
jgi:hydroxyacylglutathione hydrolase